MERKLILVTGAPRSATTPVGNILSSASKTVALYEPLGMTGLARIKNRFPTINGESDLNHSDLASIVDDLKALRSRGLNSQQRLDGFSFKRAVFGSRTSHSFRLARVQPWARNVIWKDPHAIFLVPDLIKIGVSAIITVRRPLAHAASFQRLGWVSQATNVYSRWADRFGECKVCENAFSVAKDPVISAAILWRMAYLPLIRAGVRDKVSIVSSDMLIENERQTYEKLFKELDLTPTKKTERWLKRKALPSSGRPSNKVTHDWNRSAEAANSYWKEMLSQEDISAIRRLTSDVEEELFPQRIV